MESETILVMETSTVDATLLLSQGEKVIAQQAFRSERSQEVDLIQPLKGLLAVLGESAQLSGVVVGTGPGSYNGARVGIAVAQAVGQIHGCPVAGLCSFQGVGKMNAIPVGDARRGGFFHLDETGQPVVLTREEFVCWADGRQNLGTFDPVDKLPVPVLGLRSTAEGLLMSWLQLQDEERKEAYRKGPSVFYVRPPHITKSKK